eukprot:4097138-Pyramimonas_sp.AAC.1
MAGAQQAAGPLDDDKVKRGAWSNQGARSNGIGSIRATPHTDRATNAATPSCPPLSSATPISLQ